MVVHADEKLTAFVELESANWLKNQYLERKTDVNKQPKTAKRPKTKKSKAQIHDLKPKKDAKGGALTSGSAGGKHIPDVIITC